MGTWADIHGSWLGTHGLGSASINQAVENNLCYEPNADLQTGCINAACFFFPGRPVCQGSARPVGLLVIVRQR